MKQTQRITALTLTAPGLMWVHSTRREYKRRIIGQGLHPRIKVQGEPVAMELGTVAQDGPGERLELRIENMKTEGLIYGVHASCYQRGRLIRITWEGKPGERQEAVAVWSGRRVFRLECMGGAQLSHENLADLDRALLQAPLLFWEPAQALGITYRKTRSGRIEFFAGDKGGRHA